MSQSLWAPCTMHLDAKQHTKQMLAVAALADGKLDFCLCQTPSFP